MGYQIVVTDDESGSGLGQGEVHHIYVTVITKTEEHPDFLLGPAPFDYAVSSADVPIYSNSTGQYVSGQYVEGGRVTLQRGQTYNFQLVDVFPSHPFYFSLLPAGGFFEDFADGPPYSDGVTGAPATGNNVVTFTPGPTTPSLLYYACAAHQYMGMELLIQ